MLRNVCRGRRLVLRQQPLQHQQKDVSNPISVSLNSMDNLIFPTSSTLRSLATCASRDSIINPSYLSPNHILTRKAKTDEPELSSKSSSVDLRTNTPVAPSSFVDTLFADPISQFHSPMFYLKSSPSTVVPVDGPPPSTIAPSLPWNRDKCIEDPTRGVPIVITDKRSGENVIVGDQPSTNAVVEIIGDQMENTVKIEAKRILQIKRTKMNRHKLRKWRRKYRHLIKQKIERREREYQEGLNNDRRAIREYAEQFNPVDKVRRNIELAKNMGYKVSFYKDLPLTKWLEGKEEQDKQNVIRFEEKNRDRYRKVYKYLKSKF